MSTQREPTTRGAIGAADLAVDEEDWEKAEKALMFALGQVRKEKRLRGDGDVR